MMDEEVHFRKIAFSPLQNIVLQLLHVLLVERHALVELRHIDPHLEQPAIHRSGDLGVVAAPDAA